ncbi:MAG: secretion protein HlyD family protein [Verrucomicrobiales bacterium]|nr:secretion protein HlyD family protein [Verrucomicrobiales bacterium]
MPSDFTATSAPAAATAAGEQARTAGHRQRWMRIRLNRLRQEWPLLIWLLVGGVVLWSVSRGQVFERMNGQVEEDYQYIAPVQGGRLLKIHVKPGDHVEPGGMVAELDPEPWNHQMRGLLLALSTRHNDKLLPMERERSSLSLQLGTLKESIAADEGRLAALTAAPAGPDRPLLVKEQKAQGDLQAQAGEVRARLETTRRMVPELEAGMAKLDVEMARLRSKAAETAAASVEDDRESLLALFPEEERIQFQELLDGRSHCRIASAIGGTVDKVVKTPGDYLEPGDHVIEMAGQPRHITAFLSTDEAAALQPGDRVWVTPAHSREWSIHESTVIRAAPDAERLPLSSKAGNGAYKPGRRITVAFPSSARAVSPDGIPALRPGEGITVHISHPGEFSILRKLKSMAVD